MMIKLERDIFLRIMMRAFMAEKDVRNKELARMLRVGQTAVDHWRAGKCSPDLINQKKMANVFGCTMKELHGDFSPTPEERLSFLWEHQRLSA